MVDDVVDNAHDDAHLPSRILSFACLCLGSPPVQIIFGDLTKFMWLSFIVLLGFSTCEYLLATFIQVNVVKANVIVIFCFNF